jgi:hypothetical protein
MRWEDSCKICTQVIRSRGMRRAWHVALPGEMRVHRGFWLVHLKERDHLEDLRVDGRASTGFISITLGTSWGLL